MQSGSYCNPIQAPKAGQPRTTPLKASRGQDETRSTPYTEARHSVNNLESPQAIRLHNTTDKVLSQVDGPSDRNTGKFSNHFIALLATQRRTTSINVHSTNPRDNQIPTVDDALGLLPWCTSEGRLRNDQAIALSDVGGNLKEVMLVALTAAVEEGAKEAIERAVGRAAAAAVMEFWNEEYAVD